jgi:hypothetical protein
MSIHVENIFLLVRGIPAFIETVVLLKLLPSERRNTK